MVLVQQGKSIFQVDASRWYDAHNQVQSVQLDNGVKIRFDGILFVTVGFSWDDDLQADPGAKAALREDGFLVEADMDSEASETTELESEDVEDFHGWNRGRGCPRRTAPQG